MDISKLAIVETGWIRYGIGKGIDYEKIKSIFLSMLKDIKKKMDAPEKDITNEEMRA